MSRQDARERAESIYRLWLMRWTVIEIAQAMQLDRTTVWRCIQRVREGNIFLAKSASQRFSDLIAQTYDMTLQTIREAYRAYNSAQLADNPAVRSLYLGRVQAGIGLLIRFIPDLREMRFEEMIDKVEAQHRRFVKIVEEAKQRGEFAAPFPSKPPVKLGFLQNERREEELQN